MNERYVIKDKENNYIYSDCSAGGYPSRTKTLLNTYTFNKNEAQEYAKVMHEENNWKLFEVTETSEGITLKFIAWE